MNDKIQNWKDTTWQIHPALHVPELDPEAVQIAVLDSDPIEEFRKILIQNSDRLRREVADLSEPKQRELLKRAQMCTAWNQIFKAKTGDQVYLLAPSRSKKDVSMARASAISSNDSGGRKWLATKVVYHGDKSSCWCIPVETAIGKSVEVQLGNGNALDISKLYAEIIGEE